MSNTVIHQACLHPVLHLPVCVLSLGVQAAHLVNVIGLQRYFSSLVLHFRPAAQPSGCLYAAFQRQMVSRLDQRHLPAWLACLCFLTS